ncbi:MAG: alpha/beta fold hydrolase [Pseudoclavibacter sp.]
MQQPHRADDEAGTPTHTVALLTIPARRRTRRVRVHLYRWAHPAPRAHVVLVHGAGDHGMRYSRLATALADAGCSVVVFDNLGHGRTGLDGDGLGELGRGENRAALACLLGVLDRERQANPGVPLVVYGHSWGSLLAQLAFSDRSAGTASLRRRLGLKSKLIDAVVLSGTALAVPGLLNAGDLDAPWRENDPDGTKWLSRDEAQQRAFRDDPLTFDIRSKPVWSPLGATQLMSMPPTAVAGAVDDVPMLILAGEHDTVGYQGRGPRALARAYRRRSALSDVTLRVYEGARHEVMHETNRDEVMADVVAWLRERFAAPAR